MEDNCCKIIPKSVEDKALFCPQCKGKGKKVEVRTLYYMVQGKFQKRVVHDKSYYFCPTSNCSIVYYSKDDIFTEDKIRVKVGQKENQNPQLCYCFNFFSSDVIEDIQLNGKSTIIDFIKQKVQEKACACEIMNPQGTCCLGAIGKVIKKCTVSEVS